MKPIRLLQHLLLAGAFAGSAAHAAPLPPAFAAQLDKDFPTIEALYQDLHRTPELAFNEHQTAKKLAERVKALGFEVTTGVGGTGVVAILKNGPGPVVMLRTEMDGLPVLEKTGLPFASTATAKNAAGETVPTMHACGHDVHMAAWYATARLMAENRKAWSGTLMLIGQPAEEPLKGSAAMIKDGLLKRFPKPDYAISMHDEGTLPAGQVGYRAGHFRASADTVTITIHGQGGHGATPQETRDPVVMSARVVMALQTLVSRENNPADPVVITVGSIQGGTQANIVPDQVKLMLTVRTYKPEVRKRVLASIAREVKGVTMGAGAPKEPVIDIVPGADSVYNDPEFIARAVPAVRAALGDENVVEMPAKMTSEDFANFGQAGIKSILLHVGAVEPKKLAEARAAGKYPPGTHSPQWAPDFKPTVRSFIMAETAILLDLLKPGQK